MPKVYIFDNFRLDTANWTLYRDEAVVKLQPKQLDVLIYLVEHAGRDVTREELMEKLWPGMVIEPSGLVRNISHIRKALGDEVPYRYIESMHGGAYRFIGAVIDSDNNVEGAGASNEPPLTDGPRWIKQPAIAAVVAVFIFIAVLISIGWRYFDSYKPRFTVTQLTFNSRELPLAGVTVSPQGQKLAFFEGDKLYISDLKMLEKHELKVPATGTFTSFAWYPGGTHILLSVKPRVGGETELWNISVFDYAPQLVMRGASVGIISPDERNIAFELNGELWIADVYGNEKRKLLSPPEHYQFAIKQFSQSGGQIYLLKYADDYSTSSIVAYDIKKSRMSELYTTKNIVLDFWLLPQGELILSQYPSATRMEIELVAVSIKQGGHHSEPQLIKKLEGNLAISLGADRSGNIVTVSIGQVNSSVYVGQLMDHERQLSNVQRLTFVNGISRPSDWLPDGKSVLFYSDRAGTFGIYSQAINSTSATGLANDNHDYRWPFISPDGRWLYYFLFQASANVPPAKFELMRKPLDGNATEPVVSLAGTARGVRCATTTKACVLADFDEGQIIYSTIDLLSGEKHELARGQIAPSVEYYIWDLSPDGKYLAHINKANKANEIHIISLENTETRSILSFPTLAELHSIRWDAKSQGFFAVTQGEGDSSILYHIDLDGGRRILDYQQPGAVAPSPDVIVPSPDGKYLAMGAWVFNANAWMLVRNDN